MVHDIRSAVSTVAPRSFAAVLAVACLALPLAAQTPDPAVAAQNTLKACQDAFVVCANACRAMPTACGACESARERCKADVKANVSAVPRGPAGSGPAGPGQGGSPKTPPHLPPEVTTCTVGSDGKPCIGDSDPCTYDLCKGLTCAGVRATVETTLSRKIFYITAEPKMPQIVASAKVVGVEPDPTATAQFRWKFTISYTAPPPLSKTISEDLTVLGGAEYQPTFQKIRGGKLTASATLVRGVSNCATGPKGAEIRGTDPGFAAVRAFLDSIDGTKGENPFLVRIACHESGQQLQFEKQLAAYEGQPVIEKKNGGKFGRGVGLMQLTEPPASADAYWNWQTNVRDGVKLYQEKVRLAEDYYNRKRKLKPPAPELSPAKKLQNVVTSYNSGYYWKYVHGVWVESPNLFPEGACVGKKRGDIVTTDAKSGKTKKCESYYNRIMNQAPCQ
jgi:hypothetical protein